MTIVIAGTREIVTRVTRFEFVVLGVPAPKGSSRAIMRGGNAVNVPSGSDANKDALQSWANAVRAAAVEQMRCIHIAGGTSGVVFGEVPLRLETEFRMRRRKSDFKKDGTLKAEIPKYHIVKPDLDKLIRSTKDALIGVAYLDDGQVAEELIRKVYAAPGNEGARIRLTELKL